MTLNTPAMEVARLAVVTKDFTTYYIPGHTMVHDKRVAKIHEESEAYLVMDINGVILTEVSKKAPTLVDWRETTVKFEVDEDLQVHLQSFANFLFEYYKVTDTDGTGLVKGTRQMGHSDIPNWIESFNTENKKA